MGQKQNYGNVEINCLNIAKRTEIKKNNFGNVVKKTFMKVPVLKTNFIKYIVSAQKMLKIITESTSA